MGEFVRRNREFQGQQIDTKCLEIEIPNRFTLPSVARAGDEDQDDYPAHMTKTQNHSALQSTSNWLSARNTTE
jgi:hypothetical protein